MDISKKNSKGNRHKSHKSLGVPQENVLDLKKIQEEKQTLEELKKQGSMLGRIKKIKLPKIKIDFSRKIKEKKPAEEKVIISKIQKKTASGSTLPTKQKTVKKRTALPQREDFSERLDLRHFQFQVGWKRRLISFVVICLLIILPVLGFDFYNQIKEAKGEVLGISTQAYKDLQNAGDLAASSDFTAASQSFSQATKNFMAAQDQLVQAGGVVLTLAKLVPNQAKSADYLLSAGNHLSQAGEIITELVGSLEKYTVNPLDKQGNSLTDFLVELNNQLEPISTQVEAAVSDLENVRIKDLPNEYQESISRAKSTLPVLKNSFTKLYSVVDVMLSVFGHDYPKRYLIIFQNNRELRPTGGFIGSIALLDIYQGKIKNLEVPGGGVYDVAGQLKQKIIAPKPLWLVNPHWNIQDSNWFFDFPTSAEKIMWFFERTGGATVDGVLAFTPQVIEDLLAIVGPIEMEDYETLLTSDNFVRQAQYYAEVAYDQEENQPKRIIGDMLPILFDKIFTSETEQYIKVLDVFNRSLAAKDFLLYFSDESLESAVQELNWGGSVKQTAGDYLAVVDTNIAGDKTNHVVNQFIEHSAEISSSGKIIDTVTVTRSHLGNQRDRWEQKANVSYLRFYVPEGSRLISVDGFETIPSFRYQLPDQDAEVDDDLVAIENGSILDELTGTRITNEFGKTVFGNWLTIEPGQTKKATIKYELPFQIQAGGWLDKTDSYSLYVQGQPGMANNYFSSSIVIAPEYEITWSQPALEVSDNKIEFFADLNSDQYIGFLLNK